MADSGFQDDLFDGRFHDSKRKKPELLARISQQRVLPQVKVPVEYTVVTAIGVLILVIVAYAVGVERGKRMTVAGPQLQAEVFEAYTDDSAEENGDVVYPVINEEDTAVAEDVTEVVTPKNAGAAGAAELSEEPEAAEGAPYAGPEYQVLLASVKSEEDAVREKEKLIERGFDSGFVKKGGWYQVYAAGYRTLEAAKQAKNKLAGDYRDCYIKQVR